MKHFITFQKKKALYIPTSEIGNIDNTALAHQINHELMKNGFVLSRTAFYALSNQSEDVLNEVFNDLMKGLSEIVGGDGYEPIYRNFPQSVLAMSYREFVVNAIMHYWSAGTWRPEDEGHLEREFKIEPVKYKRVTVTIFSIY